MRDVASAGGMPACMSCVMTKKTLTDFLFLEVLSHNVGHWNHGPKFSMEYWSCQCSSMFS